MNQGEAANVITTPESNLLEKHQGVDTNQVHSSSYFPTSNSAVASWSMHGESRISIENGVYSSSNYNHDQRVDASLANAQDGMNATSIASTSSSGATNVPQSYTGYATYPSTDPYGYSSTGYATYYSGYQQQSNQSYPQPVGAYQNTGAPYQPISSFQNTGSYAGPANYSSTYYNPGDYQTSGSYTSGAYSAQSDSYGGHYANYSSQYTTYRPDSNAAYSSTTTSTTSQYQQHYKQWADYYNQTQTEVSCAPGTESISVSGASSMSYSVPTAGGAYSAPSSQPPASYTPSWKPEPAASEFTLVQPGAAGGAVHEGYWKHGNSAVPNNPANSVHVQNPLGNMPSYENFQNRPSSTFSQSSSTPFPTSSLVVQSYQSSFPTVTQPVQPIDTRRASKVQIPTNPRIAPNLAFGLMKTDKDSSTTSTAAKPAYIGVSMPKPNEKVFSQDAADSVLTPGMFPKSLRGYVERALARCKDDAQMAASQAIMKEVITKATADGTLYTRDWDTEPLFALPGANAMKDSEFSTPASSLPKIKRSPSRRAKSRWEPMPEDKLIEKSSSPTSETLKYGGWNKQFSGGKSENKNDNLSKMKFSVLEQKKFNRLAPRPAKRQRLDYGLNGAGDESSSDSDKDHSLTTYASADTPEERKRRENRSKRFEKGHGKRTDNSNFRAKSVGASNLYARRATALVLSRNYEETGSKAVEDIDWDALTVKGTCQEIEKRYLRLTSAPDPSTVRPEEVLEKALLMVQNSKKNYLYKCDQLKSIRQDLTVQRISNEFTVKIYETHARLAIEVGDMPEYNQCLSQLRTLYSEGIAGCNLEFAAYNLLCVILHPNNNRDLLSAMSRLSTEAKNDAAVKHALAVRAAVTSGNYVLFFRLYKTAPNLNSCLMDLYAEKMRYAAVRCMARSYRPTVPVLYIAHILRFTGPLPATEASEGKDLDGVEECVEWLKAHGACLTQDNSGELLLDTKASVSSLYMPEPEDAVPHGDANLAVNDFLTRSIG